MWRHSTMAPSAAGTKRRCSTGEVASPFAPPLNHHLTSHRRSIAGPSPKEWKGTASTTTHPSPVPFPLQAKPAINRGSKPTPTLTCLPDDSQRHPREPSLRGHAPRRPLPLGRPAPSNVVAPVAADMRSPAMDHAGNARRPLGAAAAGNGRHVLPRVEQLHAARLSRG